MVFCNEELKTIILDYNVTILILIDGFLQFVNPELMDKYLESHNPYFNRWFSAITQLILKQAPIGVTILILIDGFLQWGGNKNDQQIGA